MTGPSRAKAADVRPRLALYFAAEIAELECLGVEHAVDVAAPGPGTIGQQTIGRRSPLLDDLDQRRERLGLILAAAVEPGAPLETALRKIDDLAADISQGAPAEQHVQSEARDGIAQPLPLVLAPVASQRHGGVERLAVLNKP